MVQIHTLIDNRDNDFLVSSSIVCPYVRHIDVITFSGIVHISPMIAEICVIECLILDLPALLHQFDTVEGLEFIVSFCQ